MSYTISQTGTWPTEVYNIVPRDYNSVIVQKGSAQAENLFRFVNNPTNDISRLNLLYNQIQFSYGNSTYFLDPLNSIRKLSSTTSNNTFTWNISSLRPYNIGPIFNFFKINFNSKIQESTTTDPASSLELDSRSYLLYPQRLFLQPVALSANSNGTFSLRTSTVFLSATTFIISSSATEQDAYNQHLSYTNSRPRTFSVRNITPNFNLHYTISSFKHVINKPLITYSNTFNPVSLNLVLEPSGVFIRPDSTFVKFNNTINYYTSSYLIGQEYPDEIPNLEHGFRTSFIENFSLNIPNTQTFQLIQSTLNVNLPLEDINNAILTATVNLTAAALRYNSYYYLDSRNIPINIVNPVLGKTLQLKYVAESPWFFNTSNFLSTNTNVYSTSGSIPLNAPLSNSTTFFDNIVWNTAYPPHYYSFKTSFSAPNFTTPSELTNLNFELSTAVIFSTTSSVYLSSLICSDFNILNYDLPTYGIYDFISLKTIDFPTENSFILSTLKCYYGTSYTTNLTSLCSYDIVNSPFVPASAASMFVLVYPTTAYGEFNLTTRTTLSSRVFNYFTDSPNANVLKFAKGIVQYNPGYPITLTKLNESQNQITVDASSLTVYPNWPSRDLTNSNISWNFTSTSPYSSLVTMQAVDSANNVISQIIPNSAVPFNSNTWTINVSGYGPDITTITLSSQKYNEVASINTNPYLFNYFSEGKFVIDALPITRVGTTTNVTLTAGTSFQGRTYPIYPKTTPVFWTWNYDDNTSPTNQPIVATYLDGTPYTYGVNDRAYSLSSMNFAVQLSSSSNAFNVHKVKFALTSHFNTDDVYGEYILNLQDFPDPSIYNTDFSTTYYGFSSTVIANTRNGVNVITRPNNDINDFVFYANNDVLPKITSPQFQWTITDDLGTNITLSSTNFSDVSSYHYNLAGTNPTARVTTVTLSALSATIAGWTIPHDISSTTTIYTIPSAEFYNPTNFILYPPYTWTSGNSGLLTLIDNTNYTLSQAPTAYANKKSQTQNFYFSANKIGNNYEYSYSSNSISLTSTSTQISLIDIPYNDELLYANNGCLISLSSFSDMYPKINGLTYTGLSSIDGLYTGYFPLTAKTVPYVNDTYTLTNNISSFQQSPKLISYDTVNVSYSAVDTDIVFDYVPVGPQQKVQFTPVSSINLDNNIMVGILQTLTPLNTANSPVRSTQDFYNGTVTYSVSSPYWVSGRDVPAIDGLFELFHIDVGDETQGLTVSPYKFNTLVITASATLPVTIPSSTFNNYSSSEYTDQRDLWEVVDQTISSDPTTLVVYSTSVRPEIFVSSYYNLTSEQFFIQFRTPELAKETENIYITSYNIYFGDGVSAYHLIDDTTYYAYQSKGVYNLSYEVNYNNGTSQSFILAKHPINVLEYWPTYDQSQIRLLSETSLTLPWTLDDIYIQPNEFGEADIFNTAITRLQENLDYLKNNIQTINTDSPTIFHGWLGDNSKDYSQGLQWNTPDFNSNYYYHPEYAVGSSQSLSYFSNIVDFVDGEEHLFVLDTINNKTMIRAFSAGKNPTEIYFDNMSQISELLATPISIDFDKENNNLYLADNIKNKIYKFNLNFGDINEVNIQLVIGNQGSKDTPNKFNSPTEIVYNNSNLFVLDYKNLCIKQYTEDLNWVRTYYIDEFSTKIDEVFTNRPENIAIHPLTLFPYVLTNSYNIYVFDDSGSLISNFLLPEVKIEGNPVSKIIFDENGDFLYVVTSQNIFKYSILGTFICSMIIPNGNLLEFVSAKPSSKRTLLFSTPTSILKCQDVVSLFKVGQGLSYEYWTLDQLLAYRDEFAQDVTYNRCLTRMVQNIKTFRNLMDSRFVIKTDKTSYGTVTYFAKAPIGVYDRPVFDPDIENENVKVGVNEFNIPQVLNRELAKIYKALQILNDTLSVTDVNLLSGFNTGCSDAFCWSWQSMSCYNLTLPVIRICNINPITYAELESSYPSNYTYASTKSWGDANSACCDNV